MAFQEIERSWQSQVWKKVFKLFINLSILCCYSIKCNSKDIDKNALLNQMFNKQYLQTLHCELFFHSYYSRYTVFSARDGQPCMDHDRLSGEVLQCLFSLKIIMCRTVLYDCQAYVSEVGTKEV